MYEILRNFLFRADYKECQMFLIFFWKLILMLIGVLKPYVGMSCCRKTDNPRLSFVNLGWYEINVTKFIPGSETEIMRMNIPMKLSLLCWILVLDSYSRVCFQRIEENRRCWTVFLPENRLSLYTFPRGCSEQSFLFATWEKLYELAYIWRQLSTWERSDWKVSLDRT